jgi:Na+/phosphate symporter
MGTAELISWLSLGTAFAGVFGIFATTIGLRRLGSMAMGTGLTIFCLAGLYTVLHDSLADNPLYSSLASCAVLMSAIISRWLTRYFNRDFDLYGIEDGYHFDIAEIAL